MQSGTTGTIGLTMLLLPLVMSWVGGYVPPVLALYVEYRLPVNFTADFMFVASFFVLGGDFWDKVRALFVYGAKVQI